MPILVPNYTDWVLLESDNIQNLNGKLSYLRKIEFLNLNNNMISLLDDSFVTTLYQNKRMKLLNLAQNKLTLLPKSVQNWTHLEKIWLSGNPFHCNCDMTWMIGWLNNFTTPSREHIIVDYDQLKCYSGKMIGLPIFALNKVLLGCYPSNWTLWQKVGVGVGTTASLVIISILLIWTLKKSREFKFFAYYYLKLDTVPKDDKAENVDNMEYDAFFCYW